MFQVILTGGSFLFAFGASNISYWQMLLGRFIFGLGGDSFFVGKSAIISNWFKGNEVAFAFGITLSVGRIGSLINGFVIPNAAESHSVSYALLIGFFLCLISASGTVLLIILDIWVEKKD